MKSVLVDEGIGHSMIKYINNADISFGLTVTSSESAEETASASDNATFIFSLINFLNLDSYVEFEVYISIIWNVILFIMLLKTKDSLTMFQTIFWAVSIVVLNIFDFCLAKEPIQMLFFILISIIIMSNIKSEKTKWILCFLVLLLSALTFRTYYVIIAMFMVFVTVLFDCYISKKQKITLKNIIFILIGICLFYFVFLNIAKVISPDNYQELIRVRLRTSSAASDLRALFMSENLFIFSIDYVITIVRMLFPVELLRLGVKYFPYVIYQAIISFILIKNIMNYKNLDNKKKLALYIFIAFLMGSATFEPDFGSWVRHEAVAFPIIAIISGCFKEKNILKKD